MLLLVLLGFSWELAPLNDCHGANEAKKQDAATKRLNLIKVLPRKGEGVGCAFMSEIGGRWDHFILNGVCLSWIIIHSEVICIGCPLECWSTWKHY
mmetsp:Transcript_36110/g.55087  ORF Transcript_36110/g.55087 Transcript_36110/m.55087 type:complete len:96 (-) Transcript_36110:10-297(-)